MKYQRILLSFTYATETIRCTNIIDIFTRNLLLTTKEKRISIYENSGYLYANRSIYFLTSYLLKRSRIFLLADIFLLAASYNGTFTAFVGNGDERWIFQGFPVNFPCSLTQWKRVFVSPCNFAIPRCTGPKKIRDLMNDTVKSVFDLNCKFPANFSVYDILCKGKKKGKIYIEIRLHDTFLIEQNDYFHYKYYQLLFFLNKTTYTQDDPKRLVVYKYFLSRVINLQFIKLHCVQKNLVSHCRKIQFEV